MTPQQTHVLIEAAHKPDPSLRPIEAATAIALIMLALFLRWAPSRAGRSGALHETAGSAAEWASGARRPPLRRLLSAVFTGCAVGLFIGQSGGLFCGLVTTIGVLLFGSRRVADRETRSRLRLVAAAPPVVDLFAAGLSAGLLPADAAAAAAAAFATCDGGMREHGDLEQIAPEPSARRSNRLTQLRLKLPNARTTRVIEPTREIAERFAEAARALRRGVDPEVAWRPLAVDGVTAPVAAAALRASRTGAPASETVAKAARDLWSAADQAAQAQLHSAGARAAMPLALCFLPAFVLVGIVPTVLGLLVELQS